MPVSLWSFWSAPYHTAVAKWIELTVGVFTSQCYLTIEILASVLPVSKQKKELSDTNYKIRKSADVSTECFGLYQGNVHFIAVHY